VEFLPDGGHAVPCESGETHAKTTTPEPRTGLQDPMGRWIATGTLAE